MARRHKTRRGFRAPKHSAAQMSAFVALKREVQAVDRVCQRRYVRDFHRAYKKFESAITPDVLRSEMARSSLLLIGDYHTLPQSQGFASELLRDLAQASGKELILCLEMICSSQQDLVDAWFDGEMDEVELRRKLRYDFDWGYDWAPFRELLRAGRQHCEAVFGIDSERRDDARSIHLRDRHAAEELARVRSLYPDALIVVVIGESHLAPSHLPAHLSRMLPNETVATVLQNLDDVYWQAAERKELPAAVRVSDGVFCVFSATPIEKYQSYSEYLFRLTQEQVRSGW